jgi:hypothetical protein
MNLEAEYQEAVDQTTDLRFQVAKVLVEKHVEKRWTTYQYGHLPTINVKCYADLTDAQLKEVRSELPREHRRYFTREYLEKADQDYSLYNLAQEDAWQRAQEDADRIFGNVLVFGSGRCGGWLVVKGLPSLDEEPDEWIKPQDYWPKESAGWKSGDLELTENDTVLHRWRFFCSCAAEEVKDLPRARAWQVAFNRFLPEREARFLEIRKIKAARRRRRRKVKHG